MADWNVVATIAAPIVALFGGILINKLIEERPRLVSYFGHTSAVTTDDPKNPITVHTHAVIVRNAGRRKAVNVRLGHSVLPAFNVYPETKYDVEDLPEGGKEIVFPTLVAKQQVTITYLYYPPLVWGKINTYVKSDDGFAKALHVLPTVQLSRWAKRVVHFLLLVGTVASVYLLWEITALIYALL